LFDQAIASFVHPSLLSRRVRRYRAIRLASMEGGHVSGAAVMTLGSATVYVEPLPNSLSTVKSPPIIWQNFLLIARPRPVPPYFLGVLASAWEKAWKSFPSCSGVMPMPLSETRKTI